MSDFVTEADLARARDDAAFRQQLLATSLERLLEALKRMRATNDTSPEALRQVREGVNLAVKLADILQESGVGEGPQAA